MCYGSGKDATSVEPHAVPFEAMMGPQSSWCTPIRSLFDRIMREAGWDGNGATAEQFATAISKHVIAVSRQDVKVGSNTCGELVAEIFESNDEPAPF